MPSKIVVTVGALIGICYLLKLVVVLHEFVADILAKNTQHCWQCCCCS